MSRTIIMVYRYAGWAGCAAEGLVGKSGCLRVNAGAGGRAGGRGGRGGLDAQLSGSLSLSSESDSGSAGS